MTTTVIAPPGVSRNDFSSSTASATGAAGFSAASAATGGSTFASASASVAGVEGFAAAIFFASSSSVFRRVAS